MPRRHRHGVGGPAVCRKFFANDARPAGILQSTGPSTKAGGPPARCWKGEFRAAAPMPSAPPCSKAESSLADASQNDNAQLARRCAPSTCRLPALPRAPQQDRRLRQKRITRICKPPNTVTSRKLDPYSECSEVALRRDLLTSRQFDAYTVNSIAPRSRGTTSSRCISVRPSVGIPGSTQSNDAGGSRGEPDPRGRSVYGQFRPAAGRRPR